MFDFDRKRPSDIPITILDVETTGLLPSMGHRVVELGAVRLENWQVVGQLSTLVNPQRKMDPQASAVNHIQDADLVNEPLFHQVAEKLLALTNGSLIVAHNAAFDANFLAMEFYISRYLAGSSLFPAIPLPNPWLCTLELARGYFHFGRNNLGEVARRLGVHVDVTHRALHDVTTTAEILKRMLTRLDKQRAGTVQDLLYAQGGPIYTPTLPEVILPAPIEEALQHGRQLRILYSSSGSDSDRLITPLYPTEHRGSIYLVAHCHLRCDQRTFRLDRISGARVV
jgi:DNA polymerase III epsilon subunit family exonuclease